jgi:hypothetical protein
VRDQLSPKLTVVFTPEVREFVVREIKVVWPADKTTLVSRKESDGVTVSRYRIAKGNDTRIVGFGLGADGKIATMRVQPDPDVR